MNSALADVEKFLAATPPFDLLDPPLLRRAAAAIEAFTAAGARCCSRSATSTIRCTSCDAAPSRHTTPRHPGRSLRRGRELRRAFRADRQAGAPPHHVDRGRLDLVPAADGARRISCELTRLRDLLHPQRRAAAPRGGAAAQHGRSDAVHDADERHCPRGLVVATSDTSIAEAARQCRSRACRPC